MDNLNRSFCAVSLRMFENQEHCDINISHNGDFSNNCFNHSSLNEILDKYKSVVTNSLIAAFGLDQLIFTDRDGGNVQTVHNAVNEIYANDTFKERGQRKYNRDDYATANYMNSRRKNEFKNIDHIYDCYTGRELPKDGRTHLEHIVSAKEIHDRTDIRVLFSTEEMSTIINQKSNTTYIEGSMNQSKNDKKLKEWESQKSTKDKSKTNGEYYGVDSKKAHKADETSRRTIDEQVARRKIEHYSKSIYKDSLKQGRQMAIRQGLGIVFTEVSLTVMDEVPKIINQLKGNFSVETFFSKISDLVLVAFERVKLKLGHILEAIKTGFTAGIFNSIITTIINTFLTTGKNIIRLIREAMVSITEAVRILFFDKKKRTTGERMIAASKIILTGASTVLGIFVEQTLSSFIHSTGIVALPVVGGILADIIPIFVGTLLTGLVSVTFLYYMDNSESIKKLIKFIDTMSEDCFDRALTTVSQANQLLDEYIARLCCIDIDKLRERVADIHEINLALMNGDNNALYKYCDKNNIKLQFRNTEEFIHLMNSSVELEI